MDINDLPFEEDSSYWDEMRFEFEEGGKCPECGGKMEIRHGRHGAFWGCTNFKSKKKCNFTLSCESREDEESYYAGLRVEHGVF